jgi:hypothetical protein
MADAPLIPGMTGTPGFSSATTTLTSMLNVFQYLVVIIVVVGLVMLIFWFLKTKVLSFNTPVKLKFEVGGSVEEKVDKIKVRRHDDRWEVKFKKHNKLVAEPPPDECAYFVTKGLKTIKMFEGFVRDNQVAWIWPKPQTKVPLSNEKGELVGWHEQFVTIPANLVEFQVAESRRNEELKANQKWWQNPTVIAWGAMGFMVIALVFIYLLYKSVPDQINAYLQFAKSIAEGCPAVQIT